ncbi:MAG TPA: glycosyltransferase family 4 protein [Anaeromyxobacter sp.]|nr:glycosyltransferase family 4 protein [Anaeromyxobacter sp.]
MAERLSIAYVHYGQQSGVTLAVARALAARGHEVRPIAATGELDLRHPVTRLPRLRPSVAIHLALSAVRYRRLFLRHRWNTEYAFDLHSRCAGTGLSALSPAPDLVLQNGALLSPGLPPRFPYALLLDHTRALAMAGPAWPQLGLPPPPDYGPGWRAREDALYQGARAVATFSANVARSLVEHYGVAADKVAVVGAGANVFPAEAARLDDGGTILFVGKDFVRKGGRVLLEAFARLRRLFPKSRLLVAGPPRPPPLPENAFHLGPVPEAELPALFAQATVFCLPTLREPFGLAFLDAMACALPCVGTRVEAVPEIVAEGETGLLVAPGDPVALSEALAHLLCDPARAREMGARGRERVAARYRWELVAARLEDLVKPLAGWRGPRPARGPLAGAEAAR